VVGPNPYKLHTFAELRAVLGPLWVRCDSCRRFRGLRITKALRDRDYRFTRFKCQRCGHQGACTDERPDRQKGMEDYVYDRGPAHPIDIARQTPVGRLFVPEKLRWKATR
jgi:transposase-like protein